MINHKEKEYPTLTDITKKFESKYDDVENFINGEPGFFMVKTVKKRTGKRGIFFDCNICDSKNIVDSKVWINNGKFKEPEEGKIVCAIYKMNNDYGLSLEIIEKYNVEKAREHLKEEIKKLIPEIQDKDKIISSINNYIDGIDNTELKKLVKKILVNSEFSYKFYAAPGGKLYHHAKIGGLAQHCLAVTEYADKIYNVSSSKSEINRDILISGALLHDIGKALTYSTENYSFDYTDEGKLLDHIVSGIHILEEFTSQIENFPAELKRHLFHIIASHHGEKEFGSPVTPKTREALIINICDLLDSRLDHFETIAASTPENEMWTEYSRMLRSELFKSAIIK